MAHPSPTPDTVSASVLAPLQSLYSLLSYASPTLPALLLLGLTLAITIWVLFRKPSLRPIFQPFPRGLRVRADSKSSSGTDKRPTAVASEPSKGVNKDRPLGGEQIDESHSQFYPLALRFLS